MRDDGDAPEPGPIEESKEERRRRRKAQQMAEDRPIEPWERYRALSDLVDHLLDIIEMADRRTRFALVILGALNALNVLLAIQSGRIGAASVGQTILLVYVGPTFCCRCISSFTRSRPCGRDRGRWAAPRMRTPATPHPVSA